MIITVGDLIRKLEKMSADEKVGIEFYDKVLTENDYCEIDRVTSMFVEGRRGIYLIAKPAMDGIQALVEELEQKVADLRDELIVVKKNL